MILCIFEAAQVVPCQAQNSRVVHVESHSNAAYIFLHAKGGPGVADHSQQLQSVCFMLGRTAGSDGP